MIILQVINNVDDRDMISAAIKQIHPEILCVQARDGSEAYEWLSKGTVFEEVDYIFLDTCRSFMHDTTLLALIRSDKRFCKIPVIVYAGEDNDDEIVDFKKSGCSILQKVSDTRALAQALKGILFPLLNQALPSM